MICESFNFWITDGCRTALAAALVEIGCAKKVMTLRFSQRVFSQAIAIGNIRLTRASKTVRQALISQNVFRKVLLSSALDEQGTQIHTTLVRFIM